MSDGLRDAPEVRSAARRPVIIARAKATAPVLVADILGKAVAATKARARKRANVGLCDVRTTTLTWGRRKEGRHGSMLIRARLSGRRTTWPTTARASMFGAW